MFESIAIAPADPILGLADLFSTDPRSYKINLGIGIYRDNTGKTPILNTVKKAERYLLEYENTKNYLSIEGLLAFAYYTQILLFGMENHHNKAKYTCTVQTPGGTAALRIAADFLLSQTICKRIWVSSPTWPNHYNIFKAAGLEVINYKYYDDQHHILDFNGMITSLHEAKKGDAVLLHGCCHNPTGIDLISTQWEKLSELSKLNGWIPLFDFAYQGFANNLNKDAEGIRIFLNNNHEMIVANSYSKNFGIYNERVGALSVVSLEEKHIKNVLSQIKLIIRSNYSNPPAHGAAVVVKILSDNALRNEWQQELTDMRKRIKDMRTLFVTHLMEMGATRDFNFITQQYGMFSYTGLTKQQVIRLRKDFGIYIVDSGRINIAGITTNNIYNLCSAITAVI
ncbi:amino acid aminotransferase [Candidatus Ishikawella capsulata]|uniref:Aminotransferase n=1 Tax=Candidatus Ishikawaella capsulata Mpkobe TaxID=476281 RepID=C5WDM2_9ENTR|nr:amino acid aminotransferase [Candidatus Ishikawaella capsulata]BAH83428.1 aspartate aminotransferase [Candidatus Ishikawaella capsulata Mpkobe]